MIFIENIVFSNQRIGGISVVWYELVRRLVIDKDLQVNFVEYEGSHKNLLRKSVDIPNSKLIKRNSVLLQIRRFGNTCLFRRKPFIFHSSSYRIARNRKATNFVTVHDFIYFLTEPTGLKSRFRKYIHCRQISNAIKKADYLICVSNNTRKDLVNIFPEIPNGKIHVIHNGVSDDFFPLPNINTIQLPYPNNSYALFIGSRSKYKNFSMAVEAIAKTELSLLIIGKSLSYDEKTFIDKLLPGYRHKCMSNVDNEVLNQLYNGAYCLIYPSLYEGFGIPVIEAQKAGCPVIAYNTSSIPEIIGNTPLLMKELSSESIEKCLIMLKSSKSRSEIIENGLVNANNFSWDKTYDQLKKLYLEAENMMQSTYKR